jgi:hypothetical protein
MTVKVKVYQPDSITHPEKLEAAKAAIQRVADENDCIAEITGRDEDGKPLYKLTATPTKK